ncbi:MULTISPECIES: hypothetical protein [unclassified Sphingopyxis]|uniref:hypothetical protein n=1 Tax=unclassified Sphingopyxis TaxID=2614943 RepID=UPI00286281F4|nr:MULTISPECIES: hypothetical protein [unclassified Sphingopyxis]MDR6834921.1 hypothetical protein [Sphingopyxis sp. BE122]MDR7227192.1 hypothetical protein [Sphingopyxis sp. BE259]
MRYLTALLLMIGLLLSNGPQLRAQIALPSVQLPDAARTLPTLPKLGNQPLIAVGDTLAQARLGRMTDLLRTQRDRIEPDRNGEPAVRGILIATVSTTR